MPNLIKNIALLPKNLVGLFSQEKSFKKNYLIGSKTLNIFGLHIFRVLLSSAIYNFKSAILLTGLDKDDKKHFRKYGYILKEDFLLTQDFERINAQARGYKGVARQGVQGDSVTKRLFVDKNISEKLDSLNLLLNNDRYRKIWKFCSARNDMPRAYIEQVCHHQTDSNANSKRKSDPQKKPHSDTFHHTVKSWYFLDDVDNNNGPFTYIPESHRLSFKRLKWEYKKSITAHKSTDGYTEKGSFRFSKEDLEYLGYSEPKQMIVKRNSFVIADTRGIHYRGDAKQKGAKRLAVWSSNRTNPFNPWIGFDSKFFKNIRDDLYNKYYEYLDKEADKRGKKPAWSKVEVDGF